jgi:hypothetical protein
MWLFMGANGTPLDVSEEVMPNLSGGFASFLSVYEDYHVVAIPGATAASSAPICCSIEWRLLEKSHTIVRRYAPALYSEIPGELAKLERGDVDAVLKFARAYGSLGYTAFTPLAVLAQGGGIPIGDPLLWIWAHADTVQICLEISYRLQEGDAASLRTYLQSLRITDQDIDDRCDTSYKEALHARPARERWWEGENNGLSAVVAKQGRISLIRWECHGSPRGLQRASDEDVRDLARYIRRSLINDNIVGIHRALLSDGRKDRLFWQFKALIEMAYWHVANAVDGRHFKRCEADDCTALFVQTDSRQRFCPRPFGQKQESLCAIRHRVHKHRQKDPR